MAKRNRFGMYLATTLVVGFTLANATGCRKKTPADDFGDKTEEAVEDVGDNIEEVGD